MMGEAVAVDFRLWAAVVVVVIVAIVRGPRIVAVGGIVDILPQSRFLKLEFGGQREDLLDWTDVSLKNLDAASSVEIP
jgi:hypothetical protein